MDKKVFKDTALGGLLRNPVFILALGLCPVIAQSTNITDAFGLGAATAFVLICANVLISLLRKVIPDQVRLPAYIIIIATFTTLVRLFMHRFIPTLYESLGAFIPLIAVNCLILGRAEAFAGKNKMGYAALDGASMGMGFIGAICLLGGLRQLLGIAGLTVFVTPAGGFIMLGLLMGLFNALIAVYKKAQKSKAKQAKEVR